jgi:transposase InsO family protein
VGNYVDRTIKVLRSDGSGEYSSGAFINFCIEHGIQRQFTTPYTPEQNGVS